MNDMRDKDLRWEEISTEHIIQDQWIDFRKTSYRYPDGRVFEPFYSYSRKDYAVIVASDTDGNYICVRQFRQGIREVTTEFPAGGIERSDHREYELGRTAGETAADHLETGKRAATEGIGAVEGILEAAKRELMEETGYASEEWEHLLTIPSNATIADNYASIFTAKNCRLVGKQDLDETEILHVVTHTAEEIDKMIHDGEFQQAVHVMAWLLAKEKETRL